MSKPKTTTKISKSAKRRADEPAFFVLRQAFFVCALCGAAASLHAADGYIADEAFRRAEPIVESQPSCYRYGRCEADNLRYERLRAQRLERLAPQAPDNAPRAGMPRREVKPTAIEEIHPAYKDSGGIREEFLNSGSAKPQQTTPAP